MVFVLGLLRAGVLADLTESQGERVDCKIKDHFLPGQKKQLKGTAGFNPCFHQGSIWGTYA